MESSVYKSYSAAYVRLCTARDVEAGIRSGSCTLPFAIRPYSRDLFEVYSPVDPPELSEDAWDGFMDDLRGALNKYMLNCIGRKEGMFADTNGKFAPGQIYRVVVWVSDDRRFWFRPLREVVSKPGIATEEPSGVPYRA